MAPAIPESSRRSFLYRLGFAGAAPALLSAVAREALGAQKSAAQKDLGGISDDNQLQGLDLTNERKYDIILNTSQTDSALGGLNHYVFAITQKMMRITSAGIIVS